MKSIDVICALEDMAENPQHTLDVDWFHALHLAGAIIRSLPQDMIERIDEIMDLEHARLQL